MWRKERRKKAVDCETFNRNLMCLSVVEMQLQWTETRFLEWCTVCAAFPATHQEEVSPFFLETFWPRLDPSSLKTFSKFFRPDENSDMPLVHFRTFAIPVQPNVHVQKFTAKCASLRLNSSHPPQLPPKTDVAPRQCQLFGLSVSRTI